MIDESLDNAKKIQDNLQKSEQQFQERIDAAKVEAGKVLEKATKDAEKQGLDIKTKSKAEIDNLINEAKRNIKADREEMITDVRKVSAELVVSALEKILSEKIDDKKDRKLVEEMIGKLK